MTETSLTLPSLLCFDVEVAAVRRLSPAFVRITLAGACLADFDAGGDLGPRDQRIKVILPASRGGSVPTIEDLSPGWYPRWLALPVTERGEMRTYTVRSARLDGERPEIDIDFVLHSPSGPAGAWAASVRPGERIGILGPRRGAAEEHEVPAGVEWAPPAPQDGPLLLVGDETAVPAVASILETLPAAYVGRAVLEVPSAEDFQQLRTDADVEVTWLARGAADRGALLAPVVRSVAAPYAREPEDGVCEVDPDTVVWETPEGRRVPGTPYAWVAGEAAVVRGLRRHLVSEVGLPRANVAFMGYWREGQAL